MVLPEELVEEILLRLPPADPASLFRAALVCKPWCRIISDRRFRRRFSEFHRSPYTPMLGLLCTFRDQDGIYVSRLLPTSSACPLRAETKTACARSTRATAGSSSACSRISTSTSGTPSRTGGTNCPRCQTFGDRSAGTRPFSVLPQPAAPATTSTAAVDPSSSLPWDASPMRCACAFTHQTPAPGVTSERTYVPARHWVHSMPTALVGNALYFVIDVGQRTLRYDLATRETSVIPLPTRSIWHSIMLMTTEDGGLGAAIGHSVPRLSLWSMEANPNGDIGWTKIRVIELGNLLTVNPSTTWHFVGFADGIGVLFVEADGRLFSIELKTGQVKMLCEGNGFYNIFPYSSWCTLALKAAAASTGEERTRGASSASES